MSKNLTLKNMKETIVNFSGDQETFDKIWETFYRMTCLGFIDRDTWRKFTDQCRGWCVDEENACIYDIQCGTDSIVWKYTPDAKYKA